MENKQEIRSWNKMSANIVRERIKYCSKYKFNHFQSVCECLEQVANKYSTLPAITDRYNNIEQNYAEYILQVKDFASGLQGLGIRKNDTVALFSENNGRWIVADQGILKCGAKDAVRGSNAPVDELDYIIWQSDSCALVLQNTMLFAKLKQYFSKYNLKFIIIMFLNDKIDTNGVDCPVYSFDEILSMGKKRRFTPVNISPEDVASILYTSGTTGNPKGVMLTHGNFLFQFEAAHRGFQSLPGEKTLQFLPVWHAYERIGTYYYFYRGCHLHYTTLSKIKDDMIKYAPDTMMSVPRIWEAIREGIYSKLKQKNPLLHKLFSAAVIISINYKHHLMYIEKRLTEQRYYNPLVSIYHAVAAGLLGPLHKVFEKFLYKKLKAMVGLNLRASVSGGGALSPQDEKFYDAIGINLRVGYGLTETAPVLTLRNISDKNYLCSAGTPVRGTEIKIIDPETKEILPPFSKGLVVVRGPQVMKGYYKDEVATKAVLDENGWFNTGDLGYLVNDNNLVLKGRMKETIVLSNGENVEPVPIEEACLNSFYINQIILVGQDKNFIGALVVPTKEAFEKCGIDTKSLRMAQEICIKNPLIRKLIKSEIDTYIKHKSKLKSFEKIVKFEILKEGFSIDNGLMTSTAKIKRNKVFEKYNNIIESMYQ